MATEVPVESAKSNREDDVQPAAATMFEDDAWCELAIKARRKDVTEEDKVKDMDI